MNFIKWLDELVKTILKILTKEPEKVADVIKPEIPEPAGKGTVLWYRAMFKLMQFDPGEEARVKAAADRVLSGRGRYASVEAATGVPWFVLGCLHNMEASCSFLGVLHNGERIIGTGQKTKLVPVGRGPFNTWEEAAIDAIKLNGARWAQLRAGSKDIGDILYACERFNGAGYITGAGKAEASPYLWACTTINDGRGKYVADGKFDPNANANGQVGVAAILKELQRRGIINLEGAA